MAQLFFTIYEEKKKRKKEKNKLKEHKAGKLRLQNINKTLKNVPLKEGMNEAKNVVAAIIKF